MEKSHFNTNSQVMKSTPLDSVSRDVMHEISQGKKCDTVLDYPSI